jgi:hypothetical protein
MIRFLGGLSETVGDEIPDRRSDTGVVGGLGLTWRDEIRDRRRVKTGIGGGFSGTKRRKRFT